MVPEGGWGGLTGVGWAGWWLWVPLVEMLTSLNPLLHRFKSYHVFLPLPGTCWVPPFVLELRKTKAVLPCWGSWQRVVVGDEGGLSEA